MMYAFMIDTRHMTSSTVERGDLGHRDYHVIKMMISDLTCVVIAFDLRSKI